MKFASTALVIALALPLFTGCGGGGGGGGGGSGDPPNTPTPSPVIIGDTATFAGSRADYSIARTSTGYTVTDKRTNTATSLGSVITTMRFTDITLNLTVGTKATTMMSMSDVNALLDLYMVMLSRVPDANSFVRLMEDSKAGITMTQMANSLYSQAILHPELTGYSDSITKTSDFVTLVYKHAFGRTGASAPTVGELETWSDRIDTDGITRGALMLEMLVAARSGSGSLGGDINVVTLLNNKNLVGKFFAIRQGVNYNSESESLIRRTAIAAAVTSTDTDAAKALIGFTDASFDLLEIK